MWVCPAAPVLESAWVSLGMHVAVYMGIYLCVCMSHLLPLHLGQQPPSSLPPLGARAIIEERAPILLSFPL